MKEHSGRCVLEPSGMRPRPPAVTSAQPDATEEQLIGLWLHGKSANTIRAYRRDIAAFRVFIGKPIRLAYLGDLQRGRSLGIATWFVSGYQAQADTPDGQRHLHAWPEVFLFGSAWAGAALIPPMALP
jgi:hypothetical protein